MKLTIGRTTYFDAHPIVWKINDKYVETYFNSETRQLLTLGEEHYVYYKDVEELYKMKPDTWFNLLLKLVCMRSYSIPETV